MAACGPRDETAGGSSGGVGGVTCGAPRPTSGGWPVCTWWGLGWASWPCGPSAMTIII